MNASSTRSRVTALLFPGQGAQYPGMLQSLPEYPAVTRTLSEVSDALGEDVLGYDTAAALESPVAVQIAVLAAGVGVGRALLEEGLQPTYVAGLSVGAFAAATTAGILSLRDCVNLVRHRARRMTNSPHQAMAWRRFLVCRSIDFGR